MEQRDDQDLSPNDAELEQQEPEEFDAVEPDEPDEVAEIADDGDDAIDVAPVDDFRLPAIRIYLRLGFKPHLTGPDMEKRWRKVCAELKQPYEPVQMNK